MRIIPTSLALALLFACNPDGRDRDDDGYPASEDCDDDKPSINPAAQDLFGDGIDQNCDGADGLDSDGDGFGSQVSGGPDCDDTDSDIGDALDWFADTDGDGFGAGDPLDSSCDGLPGLVSNNGDCDDTDDAVSPNTPWYLDADGDGWGDTTQQQNACLQPEGYSAQSGDCNDGDDGVHPGALDIGGDDIDSDCDGSDGASDVFHIDGNDKADVLLMVDNSCSMSEEQVKLGDAGSALIAALDTTGVDYHVGVVSSDMDDFAHRGKLRPDSFTGAKWVQNDTTDGDEVLDRMVNMGTDGSAMEAGRAAVYTALETLATTDNAGFARDDAALAILVLSDEDDYSDDSIITLPDFITWLDALRTEQTSFSNIVGPAIPCTDAWEEGAQYLAVQDAVGGIDLSICEPDYAPFLQDFADYAGGLTRSFQLSQRPDESTIVVFVEDEFGDTDSYDASSDAWTYNDATWTVLLAFAPYKNGTVTVSYTPQPAVP